MTYLVSPWVVQIPKLDFICKVSLVLLAVRPEGSINHKRGCELGFMLDGL